jgi:hypothetical protein
MNKNDSVRIIFRLDEDSATKLLERSKKEDIQQSKLIKQWLQQNINSSFYKYSNNLKLNKNITFFIPKDLIDQVNERSKALGVTRSNFIYSILFRKLNHENKIYKTQEIKTTAFDYYFLHGKYRELIELVDDKIELLDNSSLIDFGLALVLLGSNSKAKDVVNLVKSRLNIRKDEFISDISLEQGRLLNLQARLSRAIDSAYKSAEYARRALEIGKILNNNELIAQAYIRLTSGYLGLDDFKNSLKFIQKAKKYMDLNLYPRTLASAYLLECYIYLYTYDFDKLKECIDKGKRILQNYPQRYYLTELLYIELRLMYLISTDVNKWSKVFNDVIEIINATGSEFHRISAYNEAAAFFLKINKEDISQNYILKAKKLENIYFSYAYNKSSFSDIMHMTFLAKYDLQYFSNTINKSIEVRKVMKDNYIFFEYLDSAANFFYSEEEDSYSKALKTLQVLKENKENPAIAHAAKVSLEENKYLFVR